jgi:hypothetical protein
MKWALIFWAANPANYTVHSVYLSQTNCETKQAYYAEKFTSMKAECRPAREVKLGVPTTVTVKREVVPG